MKTLTSYFLDNNRLIVGIKDSKKTNANQIALNSAAIISGGARDFYKQKPTEEEIVGMYKMLKEEEKDYRTYPTNKLLTPAPIVVSYQE